MTVQRLLGLVAASLILAAPVAAQDKDALPLVFEEGFEKGAERWAPTDAKAWRVLKTDKGHAYNQFQLSAYKPPVRSPHNIALIKDLTLTDFDLEARVQSTGKDVAHRDACLFFGYQAPDQFYYVHLARDMDDRANQIFIVNKKDRTKISTKTTKGTPWTNGWHHVKIVRRPAKGKIEVFFDDMKTPVMTATDKTFTWGRAGIGSFDDSANWDNIQIRGRVKK
jgi:hypothetical protein